MGASEPQFCPVFQPTREEFSRPFCDYVQDVCKKNPDIPMFKVVPPKGWKPRKARFPALDTLRIQTPIKQHVFGTGGAFRCLFEEQRALSVADFKKLALSGSHKTPPKGHRQDDLLERAFWSSVTINPPYYGADTPTSFFDNALDYGWNLRNLKDLLRQYEVPPIAGVTTPMTYFGMWKSFFSWHLEDIDLYSINYLHFGAPKVWYCVSPKDRAKFEEMAKGLFPELHTICPAFLRHKDILLSPKTLRNHHVNYVQAKQEAGEFIVLNAGAYHSGFNLGFNCAEAVNFATADWLPAGRAASHCTCTALPDHVHLDMKMFSRRPRVSQRLKAALEQQEREAESTDSEEEEEEEDSEESGSECESQDEEPPAQKRRSQVVRQQRRPQPQPPAKKRRSLNAITKAAPSQAASPGSSGSRSAQRKANSRSSISKSSARVTKAAAKQPASQLNSGKTGSAGPANSRFALSSRSPALAKLAAARGMGSKRLAGHRAEELPVQATKRRKTAQEPKQPAARLERDAAEGSGPRKMMRAFQWVRTLVTGQQPSEGEAVEAPAATGAVVPQPFAIVGEDEVSGTKYFHLVQQLNKRPRRKDCVVVRRLREEADGIFRPTDEVWEEALSALVPVRSQPWRDSAQRPPGYRLLTLRSRILDTELVD